MSFVFHLSNCKQLETSELRFMKYVIGEFLLKFVNIFFLLVEALEFRIIVMLVTSVVVKVKLSLCLIKHHAMMSNGEWMYISTFS
jgi:hypothetical protein